MPKNVAYAPGPSLSFNTVVHHPTGAIQPMKRFFGVFTFAFNVLGMAKSNTTLLKPIVYNLAIATPLSLVLALVYGLVNNDAVDFVVLAVGVTALYFTDYFCNGLTASLIAQQVTTGQVFVGISDACI